MQIGTSRPKTNRLFTVVEAKRGEKMSSGETQLLAELVNLLKNKDDKR
jgi:hypothetical protein